MTPPTYDYKCADCEVPHELMHSVLELDDERHCSVCKGALRRDWSRIKPTINMVKGAGGSPGRYGSGR